MRLRSGSTTVEIKSGYGQSTRDELRSVQVAGRFTDEVTLLAAHVPPPEYAGRGDEYVKLSVVLPTTPDPDLEQFMRQWQRGRDDSTATTGT